MTAWMSHRRQITSDVICALHTRIYIFNKRQWQSVNQNYDGEDIYTFREVNNTEEPRCKIYETFRMGTFPEWWISPPLFDDAWTREATMKSIKSPRQLSNCQCGKRENRRKSSAANYMLDDEGLILKERRQDPRFTRIRRNSRRVSRRDRKYHQRGRKLESRRERGRYKRSRRWIPVVSSFLPPTQWRATTPRATHRRKAVGFVANSAYYFGTNATWENYVFAVIVVRDVARTMLRPTRFYPSDLRLLSSETVCLPRGGICGEGADADALRTGNGIARVEGGEGRGGIAGGIFSAKTRLHSTPIDSSTSWIWKRAKERRISARQSGIFHYRASGI